MAKITENCSELTLIGQVNRAALCSCEQTELVTQ